MKTAGFLKISSDRSAANVIDYNLQSFKTTGTWRGQLDNPVYQSDLVSFHGNSNLLGLNIQQKGNLLTHQIIYGMRVAHSARPGLKQHKNWTQAHTLIQSFQFSPNRQLRPQDVHRMGNEFYHSVKQYLYQQYGYRLDNGLVSTHIDRDKVENLKLKIINGHRIHFKKTPKSVIRYPHLHNHIVIPSYNLSGQAIYPYLRKRDIYHLQALNNTVVNNNQLNDYYFNQLYQSIRPNTDIIDKKQHDYDERARKQHLPSIHQSNLQIATHLFKQANDYAWNNKALAPHRSLTIAAFSKIRRARDEYLMQHFAYRTKTVRDKQNKSQQVKFTTNQFQQVNHQQEWLNIVNMRLLRWRDRDEMEAERVVNRFDFTGLLNKSISYQQFQMTMYGSISMSHRLSGNHSKVSVDKVYRAMLQAKIIRNNKTNHGKIKVMSQYGEQVIKSMHMTKPSAYHGTRVVNLVCTDVKMFKKAQKLYRSRQSKAKITSQPQHHDKRTTGINSVRKGYQEIQENNRRKAQENRKKMQRSQQNGPER